MSIKFEIQTPLHFSVRCSDEYWNFIVTEKHPALLGLEDQIKDVLSNPDEIRKSKRDENVFLFYQGVKPKWLCAVTKREDGSGFLITAYPTSAIKAGETVWKK